MTQYEKEFNSAKQTALDLLNALEYKKGDEFLLFFVNEGQHKYIQVAAAEFTSDIVEHIKTANYAERGKKE